VSAVGARLELAIAGVRLVGTAAGGLSAAQQGVSVSGAWQLCARFSEREGRREASGWETWPLEVKCQLSARTRAWRTGQRSGDLRSDSKERRGGGGGWRQKQLYQA